MGDLFKLPLKELITIQKYMESLIGKIHKKSGYLIHYIVVNMEYKTFDQHNKEILYTELNQIYEQLESGNTDMAKILLERQISLIRNNG